MRVITGKARGKHLEAPSGFDVRPTTDKVKEAIFSAIQFELEDAYVLDLFSGSGQMGIEALSRDAEYAVFTDNSKRSLDIIKENIKNTGFEKQSKVINTNALDFLSTTSMKFDIVFIDPPYKMGLADEALKSVGKVMNKGGRVICEHEKEFTPANEYNNIHIKKTYKYGKISVTIFTAGEEEDE